MAISVNHATKVITVPQGDLTFVSGTLYEMDTEGYFRQNLHALMDDEDEIWMDFPFVHNTEVTVAGVTFARTIELINGYSVQFTPDSQWSVRFTGSNNNIFDVQGGILVQNQVQVIPANSAGLQTVTSGSGLSAAQDARLQLIEQILRNRLVTDPSTGVMTLYADNGTTVLMTAQLYEDTAQSQTYQGSGVEERERLETP